MMPPSPSAFASLFASSRKAKLMTDFDKPIAVEKPYFGFFLEGDAVDVGVNRLRRVAHNRIGHVQDLVIALAHDAAERQNEQNHRRRADFRPCDVPHLVEAVCAVHLGSFVEFRADARDARQIQDG